MAGISEQTQTALLDVSVRRLGSGKVHHARVTESAFYEATHWGALFTGIDDPIVALCGSVLKGTLVRIPNGEMLESWRRQRSMCRTCEFLIKQAED